MKVSFPLSVKVAVWLVLNLLLLGAAAIAFLAAQAGLNWDSLVAGAAGQRLHALGAVVAEEVSAASPTERDAVLARFARAYHAEFLIVRNRGPQLAGTARPIPDEVRQRIDEGPPSLLAHSPEFGRPGAQRPPPEPGALDEGPGRPPRPGARGRFLVHTANPTSWWIGLRVPFALPDGRPGPATLLIRADSLWSVVLLLNFETWLLVGLSVLLLSILFWLPLVRSITHQVRVLSAATERIAEGQFETRVATNRRDELGRLGESVNTMAARLDHVVNGQRRFLADIAHELGSPIGRLQVATEILESRAMPELRQQVSDVREEVQHMAGLVNELLAFTKAGMRSRATTLVPVEVAGLFAKVLAREDPDRRVQAHGAQTLTALGDEALLARAFGNLVRNALRHGGDGAIVLTARRSADEVILAVEDEGPGVPAAALERLGEPFYRPELARTRETGGIGLGLAIVRSSVAACGGHVAFSNRTPHGFRAEVRLKSAA